MAINQRLRQGHHVIANTQQDNPFEEGEALLCGLLMAATRLGNHQFRDIHVKSGALRLPPFARAQLMSGDNDIPRGSIGEVAHHTRFEVDGFIFHGESLLDGASFVLRDLLGFRPPLRQRY